MLTNNDNQNDNVENNESVENRDKSRKQAAKILLSERDARPDVTVEQYQTLQRELLISRSETLALQTELALAKSENITLNIKLEIQKQAELKKAGEVAAEIERLSSQVAALQQELAQVSTEKKEVSEAAEREKKAKDEALTTSSQLTLKFNAICEAHKNIERERDEAILERDRCRAKIYVSQHGMPRG